MQKSDNVSGTFLFELRDVSRDISDDGWEEIDPAIIALWKEAKALLATRTIEHDGARITVEVNCSPIIRRLQHHYRIMRRLEVARAKSEVNKLLSEFPRSKIKVQCQTSIARPKTKNNETISSSYLETFLYDFFIAMNLACPASCNFYGGVLRPSGNRYTSEISLSSNFFEMAYLNGIEGHWPPARRLPLPIVCDWLSSVRTLNQVPSNRMERVLFGLMHISATDVSPNTVVWLFYALETLFDTKAGENFRSLVSRIKLLLGPSERETKTLERRLRELYKTRSSFVHGGLDVLHPMHDDWLDQKVEHIYGRLLEQTEFGFSLLLAALQEVISRRWTAPRFEEILLDQSPQS